MFFVLSYLFLAARALPDGRYVGGVSTLAEAFEVTADFGALAHLCSVFELPFLCCCCFFLLACKTIDAALDTLCCIFVLTLFLI